MPQKANYATVLPLITPPRLNSFITTFRPVQDYEVYGVYIWTQHAASSIYPLLQNLEITLRNSIDQEATRRFGKKWWDNPKLHCNNRIQNTRFYAKISQAIDKLNQDWEQEQRLAGNRRPGNPPIWSHDQIIASTDFSAWHFILKNEFAAPQGRNTGNHQHYLWPTSFGRCFKNYATFSTRNAEARKQLLDRLVELRKYRNRLFHHQPIWVKAPNVIDAVTAIDSIRVKINRIEQSINAIDPDVENIMAITGLFSHALRVCSIQELGIYTFARSPRLLTRRQKRSLRNVISAGSKDLSQTFEYSNKLYTLHPAR
ncbi:TPA: Abi family protein [Yersinia enterocolitica]|uniref:Abi family protein n=1 Tax=Yersinia enterocolitica TaxID=630 RepID=UPI0036D6066C